VATTTTFGPAAIQACIGGGFECVFGGDPGTHADVFLILPAQLDIKVNTNNEFAIDRNVTTTNTYLTTQTYDILGTTTSAAPEPSSFLLAGICLLALALAGIRKRLAQYACRF
jgi:hypothetical protein